MPRVAEAGGPEPGRVRADGHRLFVGAAGGALELTEIRPPGGRPMVASDWLRGRPDVRLTDFEVLVQGDRTGGRTAVVAHRPRGAARTSRLVAVNANRPR